MERKQAAKGSLLLLLALVLIMMSISSVSAAAVPVEKPIKFYVLGKEIKPVNAPIIRGGRVYVEFRSAVKALGFTFNYDKSRKIITARSEDAFFKIDLYSGTAYVNGVQFIFNGETPTIIESGANTLVLGLLFQPTEYLVAKYDADKRIVNVHESMWPKPKKSDLRIIRFLVESHYQKVNSDIQITSFELESWGTYVTILTDIFIPKKGNELLDRMEHATIRMSNEEGKGWGVYDVASETEYLDYESLSQKEAAVPAKDKSDIYDLLKAIAKALDDENSTALIETINPVYWTMEGELTREELDEYYTSYFLSYDYRWEQATIVSYEPNKAKIYLVSTVKNNEEPTEEFARLYELQNVSKAADGKWYWELDSSIVFNSEIVT
ncbi:stalk domain-containing protein [Paenibacillus algorifonticola]|uniref:stalk domain-containing protein n=1 Tax=Paenibacillus algorifonticola TaxID=684063 RepID=UPI003D27FE2A